MPFFRMGGMTVHVKLSGKGSKKPPAPCCARLSTGERCGGISSLLCEAHGVVIGPDRHLCALHDKQRREAEPELF